MAEMPPRAIIEDTKGQKSFYLKQGEVLTDGIVVEKIGKAAVILNYKGEKFELYL